MQISIGKIEREEIEEVNHSTSLRIGGGKSQSANIDLSGFVKGNFAKASVRVLNIGSNPVSDFGANIDIRQIDENTFSNRSVAFASSSSS